MANDLTHNPLVCDTGSSSTVLRTGPVRIVGVKVVGLSTTADTCLILDSDGTTSNGTVFEETILTGFNSAPAVYQPINVMCKRGIVVTTLTRGKVYIYLGMGGE